MRFINVLPLLCGSALGYSSRAGTCVDSPAQMREGMGGDHDPSLGFSLTASQPEYKPGESVTITINGAKSFKGLLIFARAENNAHVGTFEIPDGFIALDDQCKEYGNKGSTLSHGSEVMKRPGLKITWKAPKIGLGPVQFRGLIVTESEKTWMQLEPLAIQGPGNAKNWVSNPSVPDASDATRLTAISSIFAAMFALIF